MKNLKTKVATLFAALGFFGASFMFNISNIEAAKSIQEPCEGHYYDLAMGDCSGTSGVSCCK